MFPLEEMGHDPGVPATSVLRSGLVWSFYPRHHVSETRSSLCQREFIKNWAETTTNWSISVQLQPKKQLQLILPATFDCQFQPGLHTEYRNVIDEDL